MTGFQNFLTAAAPLARALESNPLAWQVVVTVRRNDKVERQTHHAGSFDNAVAIRNRYQGKPSVKRIEVMVTVHEWRAIS